MFGKHTSSSCSSSVAVKLSLDLTDYVKTEDLADYIKDLDLTDYVKTEDLAVYAKTEDLAAYVKTEDLDLTDYRSEEQTSELQ